MALELRDDADVTRSSEEEMVVVASVKMGDEGPGRLGRRWTRRQSDRLRRETICGRRARPPR